MLNDSKQNHNAYYIDTNNIHNNQNTYPPIKTHFSEYVISVLDGIKP